MGLFDSLLGSVLGGGDDKKQMLAGLVGQLLSGQSSAPGAPAGLGALVQQFQQKGLGDLVGSWVDTGANQSATPDQIHQALGPDTIQHFAQQTGLAGPQVSALLAQILPQLIDKVTPSGDVPHSNDLQGMLSGLLGSLGK
jgi:uncharacterized protein YidB (DUF937 family)